MLALAAPAAAEVQVFGFEARLTFDPARPVGPPGGTLGGLMAELAGASARDGTVTLSGSMTQNRAAPLFGQGAGSAGYANAVVAAELRIGGLTLVFDPALTHANAASSKIGYTSRPDMGFCSIVEHCRITGLPFVPTGNTIHVLHGAPYLIAYESGLTGMEPSDAVAFGVGRTAAQGEFAPMIQTQGYGIVGVDGLIAGVVGTPHAMLGSLALPDLRRLIGTPHIRRTDIWLFLEGDQLPADLRLEGVLERIEIAP